MTPPSTEGLPGNEVGQPPDHSISNPAVRAVERAVDRLQEARTFIERDLDRGRQDIAGIRDQAHRDMLDVSGRLRELETKVADLPSKVWIGTALLGAMTGLSALVAIIAKATGH